MQTAKRYIAIALSFALCMTVFAAFAPRIAHAVTATMVQVMNTASSPVPAASVNARQAVRLLANAQAQDGNGSAVDTYKDANLQNYTVPSGKRLVVDSQSGLCAIPTGQFLFTPSASYNEPILGAPLTFGVFTQHLDGTEPNGYSVYSLTANGTLYVDPGFQLTASFGRFDSAGNKPGFAGCSFYLAGHLEDIQ